MTTRWSVPRMWEGETVAILASGPSLKREDVDYLKGKCRVIAVNNSGIPTDCDGVRVPAMAPWADLLYAADMKWWFHYKDRALAFPGIKATIRANLPWKEVFSLQQSDRRSFDERPTHLVSGGNSGFQALGLSIHTGVKRIILLGYDMRDGAQRRRHWFGNHPAKLNSHGNYSMWINQFGKLAPIVAKKGIEVLNCSKDSALRCFKRTELRVAL